MKSLFRCATILSGSRVRAGVFTQIFFEKKKESFLSIIFIIPFTRCIHKMISLKIFAWQFSVCKQGARYST